MKKLLLALFIVILSAPNVFAQLDRNAVLKVFVTANSMDYYRPWQSVGSTTRTGSAAVISGNRILTNAHVVSDHTFIQVRKVSDPKKYTAKVLAIGHDCDLALLTVEDSEFFKGIKPLEFGGLPKIQDTVTVIGYPTGGDKLSITEGVVSRIEITTYVQSSKKLLTAQIDAAINPGNSGGPVIQDGKLVGIAMQGITQSQNIGYMIPIPIVDHFFDDLKDDTYNGFPTLGIDVNNTENTTLREYYKIGKQEGGVVISNITPKTGAEGVLKEGDVIFKVEDVDIGVDGTFKFRDDERLSLSYLIHQKQKNETVKVDFMRDGQKKSADIDLTNFIPLVPPLKHYKKPSYFVYGGFVFTVLSSDLLRSWGGKWWEKAPIDFLNYIMGKGRYNEDKKDEVVVLLQVLPDNTNVGYHQYRNQVITKVNGQSFGSFKNFVLNLQNNTNDYTVLETTQKGKFIINTKATKEKTLEILKRNNIPFQYSADVKNWLEE